MLHDLIVSEKKAGSAEIVKEACDELKLSVDAVIHEKYISSIDSDEAINEMEWIMEVQEDFRKLNLQYSITRRCGDKKKGKYEEGLVKA